MAKIVGLTEEWVLRYTEMMGYDKETMLQLYKDDALNVSTVKSQLIRMGYEKILNTTELSKTQAKLALAKEYGVSKSHVETFIYSKLEAAPTYHCSQCGAELSKYKHTQGDGLCDNCIIANTNVSL